MTAKLSHIDESGNTRMVDVGQKAVTQRVAIAETQVVLSAQTFAMLSENALPKGDALATAKIAGIMAAKRTADLIPMCHPLPLSYVDVRFSPDAERSTIRIEAEARTASQTGVEMEAFTAAQAAALTIYDMCKAVQRDIEITGCRLLHKSGGKSGTYNAPR
ncbi:cyclic pyranopterin monophosphate synthase MoaC [Desulfobaculum bizertense]|uniref:Cyclic pyranopterin monophosphate synthase n=1 Tax=Desulfobaculum bizertense DSM 18034 TaxID=1121442 RepID=A0A1T4W6W1_9BACT|nr:cyclic pyranopterin monophosphate synthase MoaC [Desulfobaculum bizertense]SKA73012.1 cyclic pyranopterin monophosphate synthase subunit MoaC [Desulfobaculum bizertense DSM 18034]